MPPEATKHPGPKTIFVAAVWEALTQKCKKWQPWLTLALGGFFIGNVAARTWASAGAFLTNQATTGWAAALASAGAAIAALTVASRAQAQSEKERREDRINDEEKRQEDRTHDEKKRLEDRDYAERLRQDDLARTRAERASEMMEAAARRKATAGVQLAVFVGNIFRIKSPLGGIETLLSQTPTQETHKEVRARVNAMLGFFDAIPIETAYEFDPNFGAHLAYIMDWLHAMELFSRGSDEEHRRYLKLAVKSIKHGMGHVEKYARQIQANYRDQHLSKQERDGYDPEKTQSV